MTANAIDSGSSDWSETATFIGADGRVVRCMDDVITSREVEVSDGVRTDVSVVPAGTVGTVLFVSMSNPQAAQLELYVGEDAFTFGHEEARFLRLHMTNEEKYAR